VKSAWKWCAVIALLIAAVAAFAAAPLLSLKTKSIGDITVSVEYSDSLKCQDSLITIETDTCNMVLNVTGIVLLDPNDRFYAGFGHGSAGAACDLDTFLVKYPGGVGKKWVPFCFRYMYATYSSQTDHQDTSYFFVAAGGSGTTEAVELKDVVFTAQIGDND